MCEGANFVGESEMLSDFLYFCHTISAVIAQLVEHRLPKPRVTGSSPAYRSCIDEQQFYCCSFFIDVRANKFSALFPKTSLRLAHL